MSIEVTPRGTRGTKAPPSGVLGRGIMRVAQFVHRRTGNKLAGAAAAVPDHRRRQKRSASHVHRDGLPEADDAWLIVASRSKTADHPSWYYHLANHPDRVEIEVQGRKTAAVPQTLIGDERAAAWAPITPLGGLSGEDRPPDPGRASHRTLNVPTINLLGPNGWRRLRGALPGGQDPLRAGALDFLRRARRERLT
jgi:hypothetical protein